MESEAGSKWRDSLMVTASNACHRVSPFDVVSALPQDCEFVCSSLLGWKFALAKGEDWNCWGVKK